MTTIITIIAVPVVVVVVVVVVVSVDIAMEADLISHHELIIITVIS